MYRTNKSTNFDKTHRRSLSAQTCETSFLPFDYSSSTVSRSITPVNHSHLNTSNNSNSNNSSQRPVGTIRIIDRRHRLNREEREARSSSVPIAQSRNGEADSPTNPIQGVASWVSGEDEAATLKRDRIMRMKRSVHNLRERMLPSYGHVNLNGKPPTYPSPNHIDYIHEQW